MPLGVWFWFCTAIWVITSFWWGWRTPAEGRYPIAGYSLFLLVLILMLGWKVFGAAVK